MVKRIAVGMLVFVSMLGLSVFAQSDVSGTWNAVVELDLGSGEPTFVFKQDGEMLMGTYEGTFGQADLTGKVTGDTIEFTFGAEGVGAASYTGKIMGDTMEGTCDYGDAGGGTWSAKKGG
ncbi:MAG TPA: hypothetical protein DIU48_02695 [Acidobacteria bacterium]|jgi:hypothetical protein|uniref:DUF2147 domain-containing protein n=1 Tax=marine metagenome TaxID=408172 RepID=A0A381WZL4_9ZZZZ|nr:hypothetical protein [Acidobacteriota bacterium]|tara:strand:- start:225 stop:584 length:360 start_codon:yes stop_codon:yes gene_type:complete